jgi:MerR family transcriptional regulator, light-induced transcriptional regulator
VLLPVLRHLGDGWQDDPRVIAREHFATNTLRPRLQRLLRSSATATGARRSSRPRPSTRSTISGLLSRPAVAADSAGWRVHYLGARTPSSALAERACRAAPRRGARRAVFREHAERFLADAPDLAGAGLALGGPGFVEADAARLPTRSSTRGR